MFPFKKGGERKLQNLSMLYLILLGSYIRHSCTFNVLNVHKTFFFLFFISSACLCLLTLIFNHVHNTIHNSKPTTTTTRFNVREVGALLTLWYKNEGRRRPVVAQTGTRWIEIIWNVKTIIESWTFYSRICKYFTVNQCFYLTHTN